MKDELKECNIVTDCDEILVNISPKWCRKILEDREFYRPYFKVEILEEHEDDEEKFNKCVLNRDKFYLNLWLQREGVTVPDHVFKKFLSIHAEKGFYEDLDILPMALGLKQLAKHSSVKNVYVISKHAENSDSLDSKINLIKSLFPQEKLIIKMLKPSESKGDAIKDIDIEYGFILDDEIKNLKEYLKQDNVKNCYIYLPELGYNVPDVETLDLMLEKNIEFKVY